MGEYGVSMPLWDEGGPVPDDPDWLERELGLSRDLVADLAAWAADWDVPTSDPTSRQAWVSRRAQHKAEAQRLFTRLQDEILPRFTAVMKE